MINSISIRNFETHLKTDFDLHPGVNVIVGDSDNGKSGIIRAVKWNAKNRPQGDSYRNDQLDPKDKEDKLKETLVGINYKDSGLIVRSRDGFPGGVNHYVIDNDEPLRALRTDVPQEVKDITKMNSVNIQGQHPTEQYFLLADKPGQVAKEFNKVAGLTIMDKTKADINSQVRECNSYINISKKEIEERENIVKSMEWVPKAEKFANDLMEFKSKLTAKDEERQNLNNIIEHIERIDKVLSEKYVGIEGAIVQINILSQKKKEISDNEYVINQILSLISSIKSINTALSSITDTDKAQNVLNALKNESDDINKKLEMIKKINSKVFSLEKLELDIDFAKKEYNTILQESNLLREKEECPVCGRKGK
jgi:exonuclease SbcC